jgi:hypothetical protein
MAQLAWQVGYTRFATDPKLFQYEEIKPLVLPEQTPFK